MREGEYLFVYGTLLEADLRRWVFGHQPTCHPDRLPGFCKFEQSVAGKYPEVRPCNGDENSVEGLCLEVGPADLRQADAYETSLYKRELLPLESGRTAWVYIAAQTKLPSV